MLKTLDKKMKPQIVTEVTTITPEIAQQWLTTNDQNRRPQRRFIKQFASDMANGSWSLTGDSIKFDINSKLVDGQHRLMACVEAKVSFHSFVVYGLPPQTRDVIDTGKTRSLGDVLTMRDVTNANQVASTFKLLINESRGQSNIGGRGTITHSDLVRAFEKHPSLPLYVLPPGGMPRGISIPTVSYINYVASTFLKARDRAEAMREVLKSGTPDYDGDPIHLYRERFILDYAGNIGSVPMRERNLWTFKHCWNAFAKRIPMERLRWRQSDVDIDGLDVKKL